MARFMLAITRFSYMLNELFAIMACLLKISHNKSMEVLR